MILRNTSYADILRYHAERIAYKRRYDNGATCIALQLDCGVYDVLAVIQRKSDSATLRARSQKVRTYQDAIDMCDTLAALVCEDETTHPSEKEVRAIVRALRKARFEPTTVDDGEDTVECFAMSEIIAAVLSVDESRILLDGGAWVSIVLGNEPGYAIQSYGGNAEECRRLDSVAQSIVDAFDK